MSTRFIEEQRKRLASELEDGIKLLRAAHQLQVRALDMVMGSPLSVDLASLATKAPPATEREAAEEKAPSRRGASRRRKNKRGTLKEAIFEAIANAGDGFTASDIAAALGRPVNKGSLRATLNRLVVSGHLTRQSRRSEDGQSVYSRQARLPGT